MEAKSMVLAFLLLASVFEPLMARDEKQVLRFPQAKEVSTDFCTGKKSWPELVGKRAEVAQRTIEKENPAASVVILLPFMPMPLNFVCGRVFLVVNWYLIVQITPTMEVCCLPETKAPTMD